MRMTKQLENRILYDEKAVISDRKSSRTCHITFVNEKLERKRLVQLLAKSIVALAKQKGDNENEMD